MSTTSGQVVGVLAFDVNDSSLNPAEAYCVPFAWKERKNVKEIAHIKKLCELTNSFKNLKKSYCD